MYIRFLNCLSLIFVCNQVRGAPAIAIVGSLSLAVELRKLATPETKKDLHSLIKEKLDYLVPSRPTAVKFYNPFPKNIMMYIEK
jgi:methylthioribose-1-phosphate isomerase